MEWSNKPREVARGIYHIELPTPIPVGPVNIYLIAGECLTLFDTGPLTDEAWQLLNQGMSEIGFDVSEIRQIVLSHAHLDHCGLTERIRRASGARTLAHPLILPYITHDEKFMIYETQFFTNHYLECGVAEDSLDWIMQKRKELLEFTERSQIDECLYHQQPLPNLPEWQVLYTPGHGQAHISLYRSEDRVMLGADILTKNGPAVASIEPSLDGTGSLPLTLVQYRTSLDLVSHMEVEILFSGHGEPITNHRELIRERLQRHWHRVNKIIAVLKEGEKTAFELTVRIFPHVPHEKIILILVETVSHIEMLRMNHIVKCRRQDGVLYYSL